jgi:putative ABC transport system substrate-binding protein
MKRREFIKLLPAFFFIALSTTMAWSQPPDKPRRAGVLLSGLASDPAARPVVQALADGLREHGWEEGRNVRLEVRYSGPDPALFADLAAELVTLNVDAIITANTQALDAARRNTAKIPIIMAGATVPVGLGFVASLARPGGNITGVVSQLESVVAKNLELLKEIKPGIQRVGVIYSPNNVSSVATFKGMQEEMAPRLGLVVLPIPVSKGEDLAEAFEAIIRERASDTYRDP